MSRHMHQHKPNRKHGIKPRISVAISMNALSTRYEYNKHIDMITLPIIIAIAPEMLCLEAISLLLEWLRHKSHVTLRSCYPDEASKGPTPAYTNPALRPTENVWNVEKPLALHV